MHFSYKQMFLRNSCCTSTGEFISLFWGFGTSKWVWEFSYSNPWGFKVISLSIHVLWALPHSLSAVTINHNCFSQAQESQTHFKILTCTSAWVCNASARSLSHVWVSLPMKSQRSRSQNDPREQEEPRPCRKQQSDHIKMKEPDARRRLPRCVHGTFGSTMQIHGRDAPVCKSRSNAELLWPYEAASWCCAPSPH